MAEHRIRMTRPWRTVDGRGWSYWPQCSCGWEGLSYSREAPAVANGDTHVAEYEVASAAPASAAGE